MDTATFTDPRDGKKYKTVMIGGLTWMAENLAFYLEKDCWSYEDKPDNIERYGYMYTWSSAALACPDGWRLPTRAEWEHLANKFGGFYNVEAEENIGEPASSFQALTQGGRSQLGFPLGGWRYSHNQHFYDLGLGGGYWTSDERDEDYAWNFHFDAYLGFLCLKGYNKNDANYVRCVRMD